MMVRSILLYLAILASLRFAPAQPTCSLDTHCPEDAPCCGPYGGCGLGALCLGGCDPRMSYSLDACVPEPVCRSGTWNFEDLKEIQSKSTYLGDASSTSWVVDGTIRNDGDLLLLTMAPESYGTVLASTTYLWYGNVKATLKTSRGAGVVTAFILFSDVKDEIDFEFIGVDLSTAQTNYYFQGIPDYTHGYKITGLSDTYSNFHTYEIDWTPDIITWRIDGQIGRTLKRVDTWNASTGQWMFPQTPARVQFSLWPGGLSTNAPGTIEWAGGEIDWNSEDIQKYGYDFAALQSVTVDCYNTSSPPGTNGKISYYYDDVSATNDTVIDSDKATILKSSLGSGLNMSAEVASSTDRGAVSSNSLSGFGGGTSDSSSSSISSDSSGTSSGFQQGEDSFNSNSSSGLCYRFDKGVGRVGLFVALSIVLAFMGWPF